MISKLKIIKAKKYAQFFHSTQIQEEEKLFIFAHTHTDKQLIHEFLMISIQTCHSKVQ
jgi:hypothetical protein